MGKDFKGTDLRDGADTQETEYETPCGSMCGVDIPAGSYTVHELAALIDTHSPTHTAKVLDGRIETREAQRGSDGATLQPMTSTRSPGETLIELLIDIDMINEGAFSAVEYDEQVAAINRVTDKLVAPYLARIAELEKHTVELRALWEASRRASDTVRGDLVETKDRADKLEAENKALRDAKTELEKLAAYWEKGAAHPSMHERYRSGLKDCAKELREELAKQSASDHVHELGSCSHCDKGGTK